MAVFAAAIFSSVLLVPVAMILREHLLIFQNQELEKVSFDAFVKKYFLPKTLYQSLANW